MNRSWGRKSKTKEVLNFAMFFFSLFFHFILTIVCRVSAAPGQRGPDKKIAKIAEHRLLQDIIYTDSYNREVRPALRDSDVVTVLFEVKLVQIVDVVSDVMELYMCKSVYSSRGYNSCSRRAFKGTQGCLYYWK